MKGASVLYRGEHGGFHEPVLVVFDIEVEVDAQSACEETGVKADVGLLGCLPGQGEVAESRGIRAPVVGKDFAVAAVELAVGAYVLSGRSSRCWPR